MPNLNSPYRCMGRITLDVPARRMLSRDPRVGPPRPKPMAHTRTPHNHGPNQSEGRWMTRPGSETEANTIRHVVR